MWNQKTPSPSWQLSCEAAQLFLIQGTAPLLVSSSLGNSQWICPLTVRQKAFGTAKTDWGAFQLCCSHWLCSSWYLRTSSKINSLLRPWQRCSDGPREPRGQGQLQVSHPGSQQSWLQQEGSRWLQAGAALRNTCWVHTGISRTTDSPCALPATF